MSLVNQLLDPQKKVEYAGQFILKKGDNYQIDEILKYINSEFFLDNIKGLLEGTWHFNPPEKKYISDTRFYYKYSTKELFLQGFINYIFRQIESKLSQNVYSCSCSKYTDTLVRKHINALNPNCAILLTDVKAFSVSIKTGVLLRESKRLFHDDKLSYQFLENVYSINTYKYKGKLYKSDYQLFENTPLNSLSNNIILNKIDIMANDDSSVLEYSRFNDDLCFICTSVDEAKRVFSEFKLLLDSLLLEVNYSKTNIFKYGQTYSYLSYEFNEKHVRISDFFMNRVKNIMNSYRRKILKEIRLGNVSKEQAFSKSLYYYNYYLYAGVWYKMFMPVFNALTDYSQIKLLDQSVQNNFRAILAGTTSNKKYNITYQKLREKGYVPFYNRFFKCKKEDHQFHF